MLSLAPRARLFAALLCLPLLATAPAAAQSLRLVAEGHAPGAPVQLRIGDTLRLQLIADLDEQTAAGIAAFLTVPDSAFLVTDLGLTGQVGTQPFAVGPLFAGAQMPTNLLLPESDPVAAALPGRQLDLAALFGLGAPVSARGEGVVATVELVARHAIDEAWLRIDDSPIRETKLVLADGASERRFTRLDGLQVTVVDPFASPVALGAWGRIKRDARP